MFINNLSGSAYALNKAFQYVIYSNNYLCTSYLCMKQKTDHIEIINSLRGVAAVAVCFYHFVSTTLNFIDTQWLIDAFEYGKKGVQLFFVISGIVIPLSMIKWNYKLTDFGTFLLKRFVRIEPPYLAAVIIAIFYLFIRNFIPGTAAVDLMPTPLEIILHIGYLIPFFENTEWVNPVFWTLAVEFQYYLFLALLFPLVLYTKNAWGRLLFYAIFFSMGFLGTSFEFFTHWAPYFLSGIIYIIWRKAIIKNLEFALLSLLTGSVIFYLYGATDFGIAVCTLLLIQYLPNLKTKITTFLGKISYSLYLLHTITGTAIINYLSHHVETGWAKFLTVTIGLLVSIFSAYLMYRFLEKPTHNYAKKIGKR